jgi:hypothetical protein
VEGARDRTVFRTFVQKVLAPSLRPGQVVAVNNLSVHHDPLGPPPDRGARLPADPPARLLARLCAHRAAFSKVKADLRQVSPRVQAKLDDAIAEARARITPEDARGFFKHCGFPLPAQ